MTTVPFDLDVNILLILIFLGFLAAFIESVVGGSGLISLPALMFVGLPPPSAAVATNKLGHYRVINEHHNILSLWKIG